MDVKVTDQKRQELRGYRESAKVDAEVVQKDELLIAGDCTYIPPTYSRSGKVISPGKLGTDAKASGTAPVQSMTVRRRPTARQIAWAIVAVGGVALWLLDR